jgi:hypothetical protein
VYIRGGLGSEESGFNEAYFTIQQSRYHILLLASADKLSDIDKCSQCHWRYY